MGESLGEPETSHFCVLSVSCACVESRSGAGRRGGETEEWPGGEWKKRLDLAQEECSVPHAKVFSLLKTPGLGFLVSFKNAGFWTPS